MAQSIYIGPGSFEDGNMDNFDFTEKSIRRGFIRKVYAILMSQLLVTMGIIAFFLFHEPTKVFVRQNFYLLWIAMAVLFIAIIVLACCTEMRRQFPLNFIFLAIFTCAESFILGVVCSLYEVNQVLMAVGITAAVCLGLTLFAFQTKWDFTMMGGALVALSMVLLVFGILAIIFRNNILHTAYAAAGALIFSLYLVYDTQLMMGGKHKYSISPEEYIFAALNLYVDIINIFIFILSLSSKS
ncbi:protein lifeguard 1-like [Danaus plexippus]|uniref:protein lifeguard 1-like n=1 Tax=Danaus plexippus TaxID=13037 RepID=UPI002AAFC437|nr:protein lifeguard 1-like [Danaus plexippus]